MNLQLTGRHVEITPAMREYVATKLARAMRHFDQVIDAAVILSVEKHEHRAEVSLHVSGRDLFCEAVDADMYVAIDALADKLDRMVVRHKEKLTDHRGHVAAEPQVP
jgi:putative sigma-54 modulation protein